MGIWFGDLVYIDLSTKEIKRKRCPNSLIRKFLGGRGLGTYLLMESVSEDIDAFDPANPLILATGILTGTNMICSSRLHICAKSPLTKFITTSNGGGFSANELKRCGVGALIIKGKSEYPVFINIKDDKITIEDASTLWGCGTKETDKKVKELIDDSKAHVVAIGPGGEKRCNFASVMTGDGHFAGRTGAGAVMGSKLLKCIAIRSTVKANKTNDTEAKQAIAHYFKEIKASPYYEKYSTVGSTYLVSWADKKGAGATRNYEDIVFDGIEESAAASNQDLVVKTKGCYKCPVKCKADMKIASGRHKGKIFERPDFEPLVMWGSKCGNKDGLESVYLHNLCNEYGVDSMDCGSMIAFAMNLYEKGILTDKNTGGLKLDWGNTDSMEKLLKQIAFRDTWLGDVLANGIKDAARIIGKGSDKYAFTVKGLTMTAMDPRGFKATALGYAVSARGSDFTYVYAKPEYTITKEQALMYYGTEKAADRLSEEGKALMVRKSIISTAIVDSIGICKLPQNSFIVDNDLKIITKVINGITKLNITPEELFLVGERIINMERLFSYRLGASKKDDQLPSKFINEPIKNGESKGSVVNLEKMLTEYYELMGWDENGKVSEEKLAELGLLTRG